MKKKGLKCEDVPSKMQRRCFSKTWVKAGTCAQSCFDYASTRPATARIVSGANPCEGTKPKSAMPANKTVKHIEGDISGGNSGFDNYHCRFKGFVQAIEQAGANVTKGYNGKLKGSQDPQTDAYWTQGMCAVNVHWHLGAEHLSLGEFDETGTGPSPIDVRRRLSGKTRQGFQCTKYDSDDKKFTRSFNWQHCKKMEVGQTYEVHWPHSAAGACGTPHQYQCPFYDGVFCNSEILGDLSNLAAQVGVQAQVFTIVNDEDYYYPDLMKGMIVNGDFGSDLAIYTGSTTGTSRNNEVCSPYGPITWQVDRKCHLISASSFDKMCADMKTNSDDMSPDLYAHGARELVPDDLAADNHYDYSD